MLLKEWRLVLGPSLLMLTMRVLCLSNILVNEALDIFSLVTIIAPLVIRTAFFDTGTLRASTTYLDPCQSNSRLEWAI